MPVTYDLLENLLWNDYSLSDLLLDKDRKLYISLITGDPKCIDYFLILTSFEKLSEALKQDISVINFIKEQNALKWFGETGEQEECYISLEEAEKDFSNDFMVMFLFDHNRMTELEYLKEIEKKYSGEDHSLEEDC